MKNKNKQNIIAIFIYVSGVITTYSECKRLCMDENIKLQNKYTNIKINKYSTGDRVLSICISLASWPGLIGTELARLIINTDLHSEANW